MRGDERRDELLKIIRFSDAPISGATLAKQLHVSRQVIVQDIALLRASDYDILSTTKGYILNMAGTMPLPTRALKVRHTDEQVEDELTLIVDLGAQIKDVYVWHRVYGKIEATLDIRSRRDVIKFMDDIRSGRSSQLKNITSEYHYHTIAADSEETLDLVEKLLKEKGYLVSE